MNSTKNINEFNRSKCIKTPAAVEASVVTTAVYDAFSDATNKIGVYYNIIANIHNKRPNAPPLTKSNLLLKKILKSKKTIS